MFERDVKSELVSDRELDRSKDLKNEFSSDNDDNDGMEEYFERVVKSEVEADGELD